MQVKTKNLIVAVLAVVLVGALWYRVLYSPMEAKASKAKASALEAETTSGAGDSAAARVARLISEARGRRSRSERLIERFARIYTPVVLLARGGRLRIGARPTGPDID